MMNVNSINSIRDDFFLWAWGERFCIFDRLINIFHIIEEELHILDLFDCVNNIN